jgi:SpoVK/Ycf46/Vps4 family AAA+-type ATPase
VFFNSVLKDKTTVLILEDADSCLERRDGSNTSLVSTLLNATDGLLGDILNLRIIATTNVHKADIDPAVTRAGRLCQFMNVGKLSPERCVKVFKRLQPGKPVPAFNSPKVLAEIYREIKGAPSLDLPEEETLGFK